MKVIPFAIFLFSCFRIIAQETFKPVADDQKVHYAFDLKKNFFESQSAFDVYFKSFEEKNILFNKQILKPANLKNLESLTHQLSRLEFDFRRMDLYLFLQFATNTSNHKAQSKEDSLYDVMATTRNRFLNLLNETPDVTVQKLLKLPSLVNYQYYLKKNIENKKHVLTEIEKTNTSSFNYLKDSRFYTEILNGTPTDTIIAGHEKLDLYNDMAKWQNHSDSAVRADGEFKLYKSYATAGVPLGYKYIEMVKGLNAFSKLKKYDNLMQENCDKMSLSQSVLEVVFDEIGKKTELYKLNSFENIKEITRYDVRKSSELILESLKQLGPEYYQEAIKLLDPKNGRMDIVGGPNRLPLQGAASVYPIGVSTFYAQNYEGYYVDIMLLAHEAGHAIQASLMHQNKVSLLNATGPAYFTESFGKFNELLVSYNLMEKAINQTEKDFYKAKYLETLLNLFGATTGAVIEYNLIKGIVNNKISKPEDLDNVSLEIGKKYSYFIKNPEHKSFWMRLNTNFQAPMHNIHSMMASVLSIQYFQNFLKNKEEFGNKYNRFLMNGYTDTPANLLNNFMGIDMNHKDFCTISLNFIEAEIARLK